MTRLTKSQTIGRKALAAMTSASLVFGGVTVTHTVVAPAALAQNNVQDSAVAEVLRVPVSGLKASDLKTGMGMVPSHSQYGAGWCMDSMYPAPGANEGVVYEPVKLHEWLITYKTRRENNLPTTDGPRNLLSEQQFDRDANAAVINLVKILQSAYKEGDEELASQAHWALRAFVSSNSNALFEAQGLILTNGKNYYGQPDVPGYLLPTPSTFRKWTGFEVKYIDSYSTPALVRSETTDIAGQGDRVGELATGSYATILMPTQYKWRSDVYSKNGNMQRLIPPSQPGLDPEPDPTPDPEPTTSAPKPTTSAPQPTTSAPAPSTTTKTAESTVVIDEEVEVNVFKYVFSWIITKRYNLTEKYIKYDYKREDVKIISGGENIRIEYDANGNLIIVPIKNGPVVIEIKDSNGDIHRYEFTVNVGSNPGGGTVIVNPEPIYVNITNNTYYITNITNITNVNVVSGHDYIIDARIVDGTVVVTPKPGQTGQTYIIVTDKNGVKYKYYINIDYKVTVQEHTETIYQGGSISININNGYTWDIESGSQFIDIRDENGRLIITPKPGAKGKSVIVIKDQYGNIVYRYTVNVVYKTSQYTQTVTIDNTQSFSFDYTNIVKHEITSGSNLIDVKIENGELIVTPKPGSKGTAVIVVTDKYGNTTTITINILDLTPPAPKTQVIERTISADRTISFGYSTSYEATVVEGDDIADVEIINGRITIKPKDFQADGKVVVEVKDDRGNVIYRYIVNITPIQLSHTESDITIKDTAETYIPVVEGADFEITEGGDILEVVEIVNGELFIKPVEGSEGDAQVVITDEFGNTHTINITVIKDSIFDVEKPATRVFNSEVYVGADINLSYTDSLSAEFFEGDEFVDVIEMGNGRIKLKAAEKGFTVIEIVDEDGHVWARYNITINPLPTPELSHTESNITIKHTQTVNLPKSDGDSIKITAGNDVIEVVEDEKGNWVVKPKEGVEEGNAKVVITDENGNTHTIHVTIVKDPNAGGEEQAPTIIKVTRDITDLTIVNFTHIEGWKYKIVKGEALGSFEVKDGKLIVTPKKGADGTLVIEATDSKGNVVAEYTLNITPTKDEDVQIGGQTINITTIQQITIKKNTNYTFEIESGKDLFTYERDSNGNWVITPIPGAQGTAVVVVKDESGKIVYRYTINITNAHTTNIREVKIIKGGSAEITFNYDLKVISGGNLVSIEKRDGKWIVTPKDNVSGRVVIEETNSTGHVFNRWIINVDTMDVVKPIKELRETITNEQTARITGSTTHTMEIISGSSIAQLTGGNGTWILKPRNQDVSGEVVIVERDNDGNTVTRYIITVTDPSGSVEPENPTPTPEVKDIKITIKDGEDIILKKPSTGHTIVVVTEGAEKIAELVKQPDGSYIIKPIAGTPGGTIILEERDKDGKVVSKIEVIVEPQSEVDEQSKPGDSTIVIIDGKEKPIGPGSSIEILPKEDGDDSTIVIPGSKDWTIVIRDKDGKLVPTDEFSIETDEDGNQVIVIKDGTKPGDYNVVISDKDGNNTNITIVVRGETDGQNVPGGGDTTNNFISSGESASSNKDNENSGSAERCFRNPATNPLVWLLPVGLLLGIGGPALSSVLGQAGNAFGQFGQQSGQTIRDEFGNRIGVRDTRPKWMRDISAQLAGLNRNLSRIHPQGGQLVGVAGAVAGVALLAALFAISCSEEGWDGLSSKKDEDTEPEAPQS